MRREVEELGKNTYHFEADLANEAGETVAHVSKEVQLRLKPTRSESDQAAF